MKKLMECLGGEQTLYTYGFFAGLSGDDFVMCYGGGNGQYNDCVSACAETGEFLRRTPSRIGLAFSYAPSQDWTRSPESLKQRIRDFVDRGLPVLVKGEGKDKSYSLLIAYSREGGAYTTTCGLQETHSALEEGGASLAFIDSLPIIHNLSRVYRESILQLPMLMSSQAEPGVTFGAAAYRNWANDLLGGRYDGLTPETFHSWADWCVYICSLATNVGHGWDFIARAYVHNPDLPNILRLIALLDRNGQVWKELEALGFGFNITAAAFRACLKNRKRRLFTQKGPLSASKILANRKIALRFFP